MTEIDMQRARREGMRWYLIVALNNARPLGGLDTLLMQIVQAVYQRVSPNELHQQLDYLEARKIVEITKQPDGHWHAKLTALGVDIAEYTTECREGIARPEKYWS